MIQRRCSAAAATRASVPRARATPWLTIVVALSLSGCEQVRRIPVGTQQVVPEPVFNVLTQSCNVAVGCHGGDGDRVAFDREGSFINDADGTVTPSNLQASAMVLRIEDGTMPKAPGMLVEQDKLVLYGWIAADAYLVDASGGTSGETDTGTTTTTTTTTETMLPIPEHDAFLPVLEIIQARCGGTPGCHRDTEAPSPPVMTDAMAYDNLVELMTMNDQPYVVPGDADASWVMVRLGATMGQTIMPPATNDPLDPAELDVFRAWIDAGANL